MTAILLAVTVATILVVAWALGASLIDIDLYRTRQDIARIDAGMPSNEGLWQQPTPVAEVSMHRVSWDLLSTSEFEQLHRSVLTKARADMLADQRRRRQAQKWLEQIRVDVRDGLVSVR